MNCLYCHTNTNNPKFCSRACAAIYNNTKFPKRKRENHCKKCSSPVHSGYIYCKVCWQQVFTARKDVFDSAGNGIASQRRLRAYFLLQNDGKCSKCGFSTTHPLDGKSILELNHIDGNSQNNHRNNLELICPNCHALTPSYRGRNVGNGRPVYYLRLKK